MSEPLDPHDGDVLKSHVIQFITRLCFNGIVAKHRHIAPNGTCSWQRKKVVCVNTEITTCAFVCIYICRPAAEHPETRTAFVPCASFKTDVAEQHPLKHVLLQFSPSMRGCLLHAWMCIA